MLSSGKASLFLRFKQATSYVIRYLYISIVNVSDVMVFFPLFYLSCYRVTVIYKQAGMFAIDSDMKTWKSYDIGM